MSKILLIVSILLFSMIILAIIGVFRRQFKWTPQDTAKWEGIALKEPYWHRVLVAFDQFMNVVWFGDPDETISSRSGRWALLKQHKFFLWRWIAEFMTAWLDCIEVDHVERAMAADAARAEHTAEIDENALKSIEDNT